MTDVATLTTRLAEAEAALHDLLTSRKAVTLRAADGKTVTWQAGDAASLRGYVADLKAQIATASGTRGRRAIGVGF
ncbi:gpW family head-tail joining protein [Shumkonia mesophila]|uniref:gpW family head-tail joining protein n=1 Tax=Shumkonia mesophila TaxID=2838854 RepID=UPI002934E452|nr:gpW family head-tail joining protein [Shumkonia mesophila]